MLSKYEHEVEGMMEGAGLSGSGSGGAGVDGERERTYQAAERCSDRLVEMSQSLTSMIEGVNDSSAKLSSTANKSSSGAAGGEEDPLGKIVRTLNSHLAQLQVIDAGAEALGRRVQRAQNEVGFAGSRLGGAGGRGGDGELVQGFGRSYMGVS
jgi:nuclear pore complex protein Nup62